MYGKERKNININMNTITLNACACTIVVHNISYNIHISAFHYNVEKYIINFNGP